MIMNRYIVSALLVVVLLSHFSSCKKGENILSNEKNLIDTLWNDQVQNTFYDITFGASKSDVIENIMKHDFVIQDFSETDTEFRFYPKYNKSFLFGGLCWMWINTDFDDNGNLWLIQFSKSFKDKTYALEQYESIKSMIEKKYLLTEIERKDSTLYAADAAFCKKGNTALIYCKRYESLNHEIMYEVALAYLDRTIRKSEVSDEL